MVAMLVFNAAGFLLVYALQRFQAVLPLNPAGMPAVAPDLAFNTAVSFATNTNWQNYGGESTMSYITQMAALTTQNFVSAATGIALAIALVRAFARTSGRTVGNFWLDLTRCTLYVLLPLSLVAALFLVWQGVPQNVGPYVDATTLEGATQTLSQGPAASQIAIKQLGTNGGGFWNANSAVPYENPTPLSNFLEVLYILLIPAALTHTFGRMVKDERQGWALYAAMSIVFLAGVLVTYWAESAGNPNFAALGLDPANMEGKEVRFGLANSSLWAVATTDASNGSVNAMHDSFTPLGGMIPIINMELGEIIFGGVGSGLYGMLLMVIVAVFVAGLMVGRTPQYLGKKIEAKEVKMAMLAVLILPLSMLAFTAVSVMLPFGLSSIQALGPHGFSEVLYLFTSQTANNGSAFAGFTGNTLWYNMTGGIAMLIGRYFVIIPMMAVAGSLVAKKTVPASAGTFPTTGGLFVGLLVGVILIIGGLTFFPALALGPIVEHFAMQAQMTF
jgi:K+-transporting ATPase ATPase A chain